MAIKINEEIKQQVIQLKQSGKTYSQIVEELGIGKGSVSTICKEAGLGQNIIELTPEKIEECQKLYDEIGNKSIEIFTSPEKFPFSPGSWGTVNNLCGFLRIIHK